MMNILGIDSSGLVASVALQSDDKLVGEYTIHNKKTHSQTLLPMIHDMLEMAGVFCKRIGCDCGCKRTRLFYRTSYRSSNCERTGRSTFDSAYCCADIGGACLQSCRCRGFVCPIMDARRQQAYYGIYDVSKECR